MLLFFGVSNNAFAQHSFKVNEDIGGGRPSAQVSQSDDSMMYIVGGAIIIGIIVYAVLRDKKEKPKNDSASVNLKVDIPGKQLILNDDIQKCQPQIPINILIGMQNDLIRKDTKRYFFGLAYNF
jgi:hypothetical protein